MSADVSVLRRLALLATATSLAVGLAGTVAVTPAAATGQSTAIVVPSSPTTLPKAIEPLPPYQPQSYCDPRVRRGTRALANLLTSTYAGTAIVSLTRPCGTDTSEHYDGRAIDWGVDHRNDKQRRLGKAFLHWLFAADSAGDADAMVRRLGVMYVIWNKRIWGAWSQRWEDYSCSGVTACHVDHMHISLDWSGAMKKTSFWTGVVRPPMNPPLFPLRATGVATTIRVSPRDPDPAPTYKLVADARYRVTVSGTYHYDDRRRHRADATCSTADGSTWGRATDPAVAGDGSLDLTVNGRHRWRPTTATDGSACDPDHRYHRVVTTTDATPLTLAIDDPQPWDDGGALTVTVQRVG